MSGSIHRIVIGTAGHIDHGKSTLVRALTGIDPDRLPEEKERGLTIDLGFAPWKLSDGTRVGFVDVPGHERFVKNMVAGATGVDFVILVVAADDGIMPQTREHLEIMQILGVKRGVVALTKIDIAQKDYVDLVEEEIRDLLRGTFLDEAPIFRIAAVSGAGMESFRAALEKLARETSPRPADGPFRMPIQRVFSSPGHGTVITGIPISGKLSVGDRVEILPPGMTAKVRGIHAYKEKSEHAQAGHSSALNLADADFSRIHRGMVAATPGIFRASKTVEAHLKMLARERKPIPNLAAIRFHAGTCEILGKLVLLDRDSIRPGEETYVQIRLEEPVVIGPGDRFVLRLETPPVTVGGGSVLSESGRKLRRFRQEVVEDLAKKEQSLGDRRRLLAYALERRGEAPADLEELVGETKLPRETLLLELNALEKEGEAVAVKPGEWYMHRLGVDCAMKALCEAFDSFFRDHPTRLLVSVLYLRERTELDEKVLDALLAKEQERGKLKIENGQVRVSGRTADLAPEAEKDKLALLALFQKAACAPPEEGDLAAKLGRPLPELQRLLSLLADEGELVGASGFYFSRASVESARQAVVANIQRHGELDIPSLRDALGTSRKYLLPLLERFDREGVTLRQGGRRILKQR